MIRAVKFFDEVIYLHASKDIIRSRIEARDDNPFGTTAMEVRVILAVSGIANRLARLAAWLSKKVKLLDASATPEQLFSLIYQGS